MKSFLIYTIDILETLFGIFEWIFAFGDDPQKEAVMQWLEETGKMVEETENPEIKEILGKRIIKKVYKIIPGKGKELNLEQAYKKLAGGK